MIDNTWVNKTTTIQVLLDAEAQIGNFIYHNKEANELEATRSMLHRQIECLRGPAPSCYGEDDCSTAVLSVCPWRMTCGS